MTLVAWRTCIPPEVAACFGDKAMRRYKGLGLAITLAVLGAGCQGQSQRVQARIELKVFDLPTHILREYTLGKKMWTLRDSSYSLNTITPRELSSMLSRPDANVRVLYEKERSINDWPRITDSWSYSRARNDSAILSTTSGGGAGCLGVRKRDGGLELRIDYYVTHRGERGKKIIESQIFYEHVYPEDRVLLFHAPAGLSAQRPRHHVVAFKATREEVTPFRDPFYSSETQPYSTPVR